MSIKLLGMCRAHDLKRVTPEADCYAVRSSQEIALPSMGTQIEPRPRRGLIYVFYNRYMPSLVKIGRTWRTSDERASELSRPTGVPDDFEVIFEAVVSDVIAAERTVHQVLSEKRVPSRKEFFEVSVREGIRTVMEVAKRYPVDEEAEAIEAEILPLLERRMRRWLRRELVSVKFVQFSDICILRVTEQPDLTQREAHQIAIDLRVLGDHERDCELFNPRTETLRENVAKFLNLDPYSMIMVGLRLLSDEAAYHVAWMVEQQEVEPPLEPPWKIETLEFDMWGSEEEDKDIIHKIKETGPVIGRGSGLSG
jgi:T5orf172 domain